MAILQDVDKQMQIIKRGTVEIISEQPLRRRIAQSIKSNKPLIIKAGFDPTAPDIHLGHTVLLRKLRQFQELGHKVIFLVGDFTAIVGDPSGQTQTRKTLTFDEVSKNVKTYIKQVGKILDVNNKNVFEIKHNSHWFGKGTTITGMDFMDLTEFLTSVAAKYTVARLIERDDFAKRLKEKKPITVLELLYPLMQGYDSVVLKADVELGGTDQKFNLLVGRDIQSSYSQQPQVVITMPLLEGTDGVQKMSKSYNNYIGITEPSGDMYGKIMSISDEMMMKYYELLTDVDLSYVKGTHPMDAKKKLAYEIVRQYHSEGKAQKAQAGFERTFQKRDPFSAIKAIELTAGPGETRLLINTLCDKDKLDIIESKSDFRRLITQGAITVNGQKITDAQYRLEPNKEYSIKVGKTRFSKIILR